jgi:hypothetical protein
VAGALVRSSDEFGFGGNAVSEKREDVTTNRQVVGERHFEGSNKDQKAKGASDWSQAIVPVLGPLIRGRVGGHVSSRHRQVGWRPTGNEESSCPRMRVARFGRIINITRLVTSGLAFRSSYAPARQRWKASHAPWQ